MHKFAVIDFESAGLYDDAVVLSFGMTLGDYADKDRAFESIHNEGLYLEFDYKEQIALGRKSDQSTLDWWKKQSPEARKVWEWNDRKISIKDFRDQIIEWFDLVKVNPKHVDFYDRKSFDIFKIQHILEKTCGQEKFWGVNNTWEVASVLRILTGDRYGNMPANSFPYAVHHNALDDAVMDHMRLMKALHQND